MNGLVATGGRVGRPLMSTSSIARCAPNQTDDLLNAALDYAARGWPVLPLWEPRGVGVCACGAGCQRVGKHPRTAHGVGDATTDPEQIRAWWQEWPTTNIGIATGRASGLLVVDVDGPHAARVADARGYEAPTTQTTGRP